MTDPVLSLQIDTPSAAAGLGYLILDDPTNGLLDTGLLAPDVIYAEQISHARNIQIQRGVSQFTPPLFRANAGTLTAVLDNTTRAFDPTTSSDIIPGRAVTCQVTYAATTYPLFTGIIHSWNLGYTTKHGDATTTIGANDGVGELTRLNITENRPQESSGSRVQALLNIIGWPSSLRAVSPGSTIMPPSAQTVSAWSALQIAQDSEMGEMYVAADGTFTFRGRDVVMSDSRSRTSQATFGDGGGELAFSQPVLSSDDSAIINDLRIVYNQAGDAVTVTDGTSISQYGIHSLELQVEMTDPTVAENLGLFLLSQFSQPYPRVAQITVKPFRDMANLFPQVLGRQLGDRITVKFQPPGGGSRIVHDCFIRGITHSFSAAANARDWTTTFALQDASLWPSVFLLNSSNLNSTDVLWF